MASRWLPALVVFTVLPGCSGLSDADAAKLVERYNERVVAAFRTGDARLVDPVTGPTDGKRITGLIGVKLDQGITLDAELLAFAVQKIERRKDEIVVLTEERWYYRDRKIGSGEQVGQDSRDHYFMRYHLQRQGGHWVVDHIAFERQPEVGRTEVPNRGDFGSMHGFELRPDGGARPGGASAEPGAPTAGATAR